MKLGFTTMNTAADVRCDVLGKELEAHGFDSLWIGEHSHIPVSRRTPYPAGGELPEAYKQMMDPFISLTMAAMATTELLVCTGVALPLEHDLFALAKTVATLDVVSNGRVKFGVGVGWNEEELANHHPVPWRRRYQALEEAVAALRTLWTDDESTFHGEYAAFDAVWSYPKPIQRPHPPIVGGMSGRLGLSHTVRWADEWNPVDVALGNVDKAVSRFRAAAADAGRPPVPISLTVFGNPTLATLASYRDLGIDCVVLGAARNGWDSPDSALPFIERYGVLIERLA